MKLSVIIPTHNGEKTLERAIKSVLNQSIECEKEILICDDRSIDNTIEIAKKFNCKILINYRKAGGPNAGRNRGIMNAKGDYIAFLDQDDEWLPNKLKIQFNEESEFTYSRCIKKQE